MTGGGAPRGGAPGGGAAGGRAAGGGATGGGAAGGRAPGGGATGPGLLVVLSGPSGVGKDTVLGALTAMTPRIRRSVSFTTRPPRPGEVDGVSYSFVDGATFQALVEAGDLLEWANVHGHLYGTSRGRVREAIARGDDVVLKIDVQGAAQVRERAPEALLVFLLPPSADALRQRLHGRGTDSGAELARREADSAAELARAVHYDHSVVNDRVERAAREVLDIIERTRGQRVAR